VTHALGEPGCVEFFAGDFALARSFYEEALVFAQESGEPTTIARSVGMIAECARRAGNFAEAKPELRRAVGLFVDLDLRRFFPELLQEVAVFAKPIDAARLLSAAERLEEEMGTSRWDPADCERTLAMVRRALPSGAFDAAWQKRRSLSDEEAMALALESLD
jgi:hypothetical protein